MIGKILVCFGTRPEAIKMAPVIHELQKEKMEFKICITGQHREMLDQVLDFFEIAPDYDLDLMRPGQQLNSLGAGILQTMNDVLIEASPDMVLVQGDTTTAFMVALAAYHRGIKIGHIEAGLRTYNHQAPFPEEGNRQLISRIATKHFVPTQTARENLLQEAIPEEQIMLTGNTVVDALEFGRVKLFQGYSNDEIAQLKEIINPDKKLILVTGHRRENFGNALEDLCEALKEIAARNLAQIVFPVHLNPQVKEIVTAKLSGLENIHLISPVNYPCLLWLLEKSDLIISDSGGIQEEAPSFQTPLLVTRQFSERMEGVRAGFSFIVGSSKKTIIEKTTSLLTTSPRYNNSANPYGDGKAAQRIVSVLKTGL